jgi:hypothetical protein
MQLHQQDELTGDMQHVSSKAENIHCHDGGAACCGYLVLQFFLASDCRRGSVLDLYVVSE